MEHFHAGKAGRFAATIIREKFDYTRWQREYFDRMSPEEISQAAEKFEQNAPYAGNAVRL